MRSDVKAMKGKDGRDRVGSLTLKADNEGDAAILALIYRHLFSVCIRDGIENPRRELYELLRLSVDDLDSFPSTREEAKQ